MRGPSVRVLNLGVSIPITNGLNLERDSKSGFVDWRVVYQEERKGVLLVLTIQVSLSG